MVIVDVFSIVYLLFGYRCSNE